MYIKDVAEVIGGYAFRGAIKPDINGDIFVFQAKDIVRGESFVEVGGLTKISHDVPEYFGHLKKNDVLLVARGMKSGTFKSTVFSSEASNVIASSSVLVIRITVIDVVPKYISNFLNSKEGQDALSQIVSGSYIGAISRRELEKIKIPIPPLRQQEILINLQENIRRQEEILNQRKKIGHNIINEAFKKITIS